MILHAILPFLCLLFTESLKEEIMTSGIVDIARQLSCHEEEKVREAANTFVAVLEEALLERWTEKSTKMYRTSEWLSLCCLVEMRRTEIEWVLMPKCETWTPARSTCSKNTLISCCLSLDEEKLSSSLCKNDTYYCLAQRAPANV